MLIRVKQEIEHFLSGQRLQDSGATEFDGHVKDGETYCKAPELTFLGRRLTVVLRFFSLVAC